MPCWGQDTDKTALVSQVCVRRVEISLDKSILGDMSPGQPLWASCAIHRLALGYPDSLAS